MRVIPCAAAALAVTACGLPPGAHTENDAKPLEVHSVEWNPTHADVGKASGVVDLGSDVVVFSGPNATIFASGAVENVDTHGAAWKRATTIPAPDGSGIWIAAVDDQGKPFRLKAKRSFEPIGDRYGIRAAHVASLTGTGDHLVGFDLGSGKLAVADGRDVVEYSGAPSIKAIASGGGTVGALTDGGVWSFDASAKTPRVFDLSGARYLAVDEKGRLYAATDEAVYAARDDGTLALRFRSASDSIHGLAASGGRVWFADGTELGVVGDDVALTHGARAPENGSLAASSTGDVWTIDDHGTVTRWATGKEEVKRIAWADTAAPVFARVCATCHASGGSSGIDLSTETAWSARKDKVRDRVLVKRDMPPRGQILTEADRHAIEQFISSAR